MSEKDYILLWNKATLKYSKRPLILITIILTAFIAGTAVFCTISGVLRQSGTKALTSSISASVIRLHIVANSDSEEDQAIKLKVRDAVNEYLAPLLIDAESREEAYKIIDNELEELELIADSVLKSSGFSYLSSAVLGTFSFPEKQYGDMHMPAGIYEALRIELGEAAGHNWWCVIFPGLCFVDEAFYRIPDASRVKLDSLLTDEEYDYLFDRNTEVTFRFFFLDKIRELLGIKD